MNSFKVVDIFHSRVREIKKKSEKYKKTNVNRKDIFFFVVGTSNVHAAVNGGSAEPKKVIATHIDATHLWLPVLCSFALPSLR